MRVWAWIALRVVLRELSAWVFVQCIKRGLNGASGDKIDRAICRFLRIKRYRHG